MNVDGWRYRFDCFLVVVGDIDEECLNVEFDVVQLVGVGFDNDGHFVGYCCCGHCVDHVGFDLFGV